jgi:hypothetical protein
VFHTQRKISIPVALCLYKKAMPTENRLLMFRKYRGVDKSLARPTSRCILFDGYNISFDASLAMYSANIPPIMIINRIYKYETQNLLSL